MQVSGGGGAAVDGLDEAVALYSAHRLSLVRLAVLLVDDVASAEDVVQDAFAGFLGRSRALEDPDRALAYLQTSVVNGARSALRRRRTARAYVPPQEVEPEGPSGRAELAEAEIADALGISRGTVKSTASRGLDALEKIMTTTEATR